MASAMGSISYEQLSTRQLDTQVARLRKKMEREPRKAQIIRTERGAGYVFIAPVEVVR